MKTSYTVWLVKHGPACYGAFFGDLKPEGFPGRFLYGPFRVAATTQKDAVNAAIARAKRGHGREPIDL